MRNQLSYRGMTIVAACLLALAGCKSDEPPKTDGSSMQEFFPPYADRQIHKFQDVQIASAVRAESTMLPYYFDGAELNDVGRDRLDMMVDTDPDHVTTVYMNFPESDMMDQRRAAVLAYMGSKGMQEGNLKFVSGPNPARMVPVAGNLKRLPRTESTGISTPDPGMVPPSPSDGN